MLGPTARPSVPGWGPRACISLHRVRRSLSHNLAPVPPPSSSPGTSASDQTSRRLASLCSLNVPSSFQRRGFCSSCAWKSLLPRGNCCISSRAAPLWGLPWPPASVSQGCCSEDGRPCREQGTSAPPQFWELEVPAKAPAGLCSLCRLCRRTCSPPFSELLLGALSQTPYFQKRSHSEVLRLRLQHIFYQEHNSALIYFIQSSQLHSLWSLSLSWLKDKAGPYRLDRAWDDLAYHVLCALCVPHYVNLVRAETLMPRSHFRPCLKGYIKHSFGWMKQNSWPKNKSDPEADFILPERKLLDSSSQLKME